MASALYYVYRNLHKGGFSIKHRGRVVARPQKFILIDPELRVSKAGQTRARTKGARNVHAFVVGCSFVEVQDAAQLKLMLPKAKKRLYYNPFKYDTFVDADSHKPITSVSVAYFDGDTAYYK